MRRAVRKQLFSFFDKAMSKCFPEFELFLPKSQPVEYRLYRRPHQDGGTQFIALVTHESRDMFTLELAWSDDNEFPAYAMPSLPGDPPRPKVRLRISSFWRRTGADEWWELTTPIEKGLPPEQWAARLLAPPEPVEVVCGRIAPAVQEAVSRLQSYALPYLERAPGASRHSATRSASSSRATRQH